VRSNSERLAEADLDRLIVENRIPGIQYVVMDAAGIRFQYCGGSADLSAGKPVGPDTTFMASSSTKVMTAAAILLLVDRDRLRLDDRLTAHFSNHPYGDRITIRHLLAQTSGIPNPLPLKWLHPVSEHDRFDENAALAAALRQHPRLRFAPGDKYGYSNISYWLLGKVIETVSGTTYTRYMRTQVFEPLGIPAEAAGFEFTDPARRAIGYQTKYSIMGLLLYLMMDRQTIGESARGRFSLRPVCMNGPAYGGLICTATAFATFLQDLLRPQPRLLSAASRALFLTTQATNDGRDTGMTLGWRTGRLDNEPYYGKPGGGPGFRSNVRLYPGKGIGVAWLANETGVSEREMNQISDSIDRHWLG
jgi:CubicO group peptidase (beta-lactamase class C family)